MGFRAFVTALAIVAVVPSSSAAFQVPLLLGPMSLAPGAVAGQAVPRSPAPPVAPAPVPTQIRLVPQRYPYPPPYRIPRRPHQRPTLGDRVFMGVFLTVMGGLVLSRMDK